MPHIKEEDGVIPEMFRFIANRKFLADTLGFIIDMNSFSKENNKDTVEVLYRLFDYNPNTTKTTEAHAGYKSPRPPPSISDFNGKSPKPSDLRPQTFSRSASCEAIPAPSNATTKNRSRLPSPMSITSTSSSELPLPRSMTPSIWTPSREASEETEHHDQ
ncbi:MAG: hypothetical protein LQ351_004657 [Letrouitia transgressa]|nr:MAG: hypothetical protein LQ351_004657 [Letrouitia transgressa]